MPRLLLPLLLALPLAGHALCTSDSVAEPAAVLERFVSADCAECWRDPASPRPGPATLALDWVVPGRRGEDAPLSAVAIDEARDRLALLGQPTPRRAASVTSRRSGAPVPVRLAQGATFNDYVAASLELPSPGREPWTMWLLLVEQLPAGLEGSPVARNLVRNVFRPDWDAPGSRAPGPLAETRAMQVHAGGQPDRLRLVGLLQDGRGRMRAIRLTGCRP